MVTALVKSCVGHLLRLETFLAFAMLALLTQLFPALGEGLLSAAATALAAMNMWRWSWWHWLLFSFVGLSGTTYLKYSRGVELDWMGRPVRLVSSANTETEESPSGLSWLYRLGAGFLLLQLGFLVRTHPESVLAATNFAEWSWFSWVVAFLSLTCLTSAVRFGPKVLGELQLRHARALDARMKQRREQERLDRIKRDQDLRERFERRLPYT